MLFELDRVSLAYQGPKRLIEVFKDFSLAIAEGDFLAVMGPSGSGKSTLLSMLAGFLPPTSGTVRFRGEDLYRYDERRMAEYRNTAVGLVHQSFNLLPDLTAAQNVMVPMLIRGERLHVARDRASDLLDLVGLSHREGHLPGEMSGGEQQRVAIARALANEPAVLLCDEPTGNLDAATTREVVALLKDLHETQRRTLVIVTHDHDVAAAAENVIAVDGDGRR